MQLIISLLIIVGSLVGGYLGAGGNIYNLNQPFEFLMLSGSGLGFFLATNSVANLKQFGKFMTYFFKDPYSEKKFQTVIGLMFQLHTAYNKDKKELSNAIDNPFDNPIFQKYPDILKDADSRKFICNNLSLLIDASKTISVFTFEDMLDAEITSHKKEWKNPYKITSALTDTFPALGIAAAVMGIMLSMQYLDAGMAELGHHIGSALFGTFLGIFYAYGIFKPIAYKFAKFAEEGELFLNVIKTYIMCIVKNYDPLTSAAVTNKDVPPRYKLDTAELRERLQNNNL